MESQSRVASSAAGIGLFGLAAMALGPAAVGIGVITPIVAFGLVALGVLCGLFAIIIGLIGVWHTRSSTGRGGRGRAIVGLGVGLTLVLIILMGRGDADSRADFNDISTDLDDPPQWVEAQKIDANRDRDLSYPKEFAAKQRDLYPDLAPIAVAGSAADAFQAAEAAARSLGWEITYTDPPNRIEATDTTKIFRFVDDIAIRVRTSGSDSTIDIRSKSRDGRGDLGANANRIRAFRDALQ